MELRNIESLLYRLITAPEGVRDGLGRERRLPAGGLGAIIDGDDRLDAVDRLDIYANMYFYRLLDVLREDFPATAAVVGTDLFHNLVTGYLLEHPPTEPSIAYAGRYLAKHLRTHPLLGKFPFLPDLAALERATIEVFHAPNAEPLDMASLRALPVAAWPRLRLRTHPALRILKLSFKVVPILSAVESGGRWNAPHAAPTVVLVWRLRSRVRYRDLEPVESLALARLARGSTFRGVCDLVANETEAREPVAEMKRLLAIWVADGLLVRAAPARHRRR